MILLSRVLSESYIKPCGMLTLLPFIHLSYQLLSMSTLWHCNMSMTTLWPNNQVKFDEVMHSPFTHWWISWFGGPLHVISDQGHQSVLSIWTCLAHSLGFSVQHTTAYHLQSNGLAEQFQGTFKSSPHACLSGCDWAELTWILLSWHTTPKEDTGYSPAALGLCHIWQNILCPLD